VEYEYVFVEYREENRDEGAAFGGPTLPGSNDTVGAAHAVGTPGDEHDGRP
jgi:hypothetical protein